MGRFLSNSQLSCLWLGIAALLMLLAVIQNREFAGMMEISPIATAMPGTIGIIHAWSDALEMQGVNRAMDELRFGWKKVLGMEP